LDGRDCEVRENLKRRGKKTEWGDGECRQRPCTNSSEGAREKVPGGAGREGIRFLSTGEGEMTPSRKKRCKQ